MKNRLVGTLPVLMIAFTAPTWADDRAKTEPECKEITARLIQVTNAQFDHFSPSGDNVFLRQPLACEFRRKPAGDTDLKPARVPI